MAKQLNVNLSFNADISQAKAQIQALSKSLQDVAKMPGNASNLFDDTQIKKASQAALELQQHLSKAVNVDTGKLDLSRFSSSLKTSNKDLSIYCNTLLSAGEKGQQAFLQLAQAIAAADTPVARVNKKLAEMGTVLKNTARWQISSSILHGFMGAVQSAYNYAQDLNESLNEIRIVTGQNIEQMSKFAKEANRAARALSATTTEYTDASLIYYQQGLSDSEVAKRTDVTIKMANVAGKSAQAVSDQLTAIWNNFYDGSKSLEYYADVMTALGAATASSTDEIAGGLEKFAAIGETIGLSYEYAASALATITSNTRQSEEVVGTALKTIFARIQGLKLGETLEDGLDLNKYSAALQTIGISIFDSTGELKKMDTILDEMGAKWENLNKAQQVALAQTVAGVRQYNQLISLMDNWDKGDSDSFQANLNTARNSEGALQQQADIYAESWEAAQDRVTAAVEHIYSSLINDEFFIDLLNRFEKVLEMIGGLVDGLGGLKGIIGIVGSVFLTSFAKQMPEALTNLRQNLMVFTGQSKKAMQKVQSELNIKLAEQQANPALSKNYKIQLEGISKVNAMKQKLVLASKDLSNQEREEYEAKIRNIQAMYEEAAALAKKKKAAEELAATTMRTASRSATRASTGIFDNYASQQDKIGTLEEKTKNPNASLETTNTYAQVLEAARQKAVELELQIEEVKKAYSLTADEVDVLIGTNTDQSLLAETQKKIADKVKETTKSFTDQIKQRSNLENISTSVKSQAAAWQNVAKEIKKAQVAGNTKNLSKNVDETKQKMQQYLGVLQKLAQENGIKLSESMIQSMSDTINDMNIDNIEQVTRKFNNFAQVISGKANAAITTLDGSIEDLRGDMSTMQFNENEIREMEQAAEGAATANQELSDSMTNISGAADENVQGIFKMSTALTEFASVAMSVSSLITSMQSAISVFGDEGATGLEKFGAAISVIMPLMSTFNALQALSTTLSRSGLVTKLLEAKGYEIITTKTGALTIAKIGEAEAVAASTAAWYASPIMWISLVIIGVIAAMASLIAVFSFFNDIVQKNSAEGKLEAAKKKAEELNSVLEDTKQAAEDLKSSFDSYDSVVEALENCTEGTQEWRNALQEVNNEVLDLIKQYPELASMTNDAGDKAITKNERTGQLEIADWARDEILENANEAVLNTQTASILANQDVREAQIKVDEKELGKSIRKSTDNITTTTDTITKPGHAASSQTSAYYGQDLPEQQVTIDASRLMQDFIKNNAIKLSSMTPEDQKELLEAYAKSNNIDTDIEAWSTALSDLGPQFGELASTIEANTAAIRLENETIAASILANEEAVQNSEYAKEITQIVATDLDKATQEEIKKLKNAGWGTKGISKLDGVNAEAREIFKEYAEAAGITDYDLLDTTGTDKNRKFVYNNGEKEITVSLEAMRSVVAASRANEQLAKNANQLITTLSNKTDEQVAAITAVATKDINDFSVSQIDGSFKIDDFAKTLSEVDLKAMGYEGDLEDMRSAYVAEYNEMANNAQNALADIINDYGQKTQDALGSLDLGQLTLGQVDALGTALEQALVNGGQKGIETLSNMYSQATEKGFGDEFVDALAGVDWATITPTDLGEHLRATGVEMEFTDEALTQLISSMVDGVTELENVNSRYQKIQKITKDLSTGDDISAEDYKLLGEEYQQYFSLQADGTAILTTKASKLRDIIHGIEMGKLEEVIHKQQEKDQSFYEQEGSMSLESAKGALKSHDAGQSYRDKDLNAYMEAVNAYYGQEFTDYEEAIAFMEQENTLLKEAQNSIALNAQSRDELNGLLEEGLITTEQLNSASETVFANEVKSEGFNLEEIYAYADALISSEQFLEENREEAQEFALTQMKMERGFKNLVDNYEDWNDVLGDNNASLKDISKVMPKVNDMLQDMVGLSDEDFALLPDDFAQKYWSLIQDVYNQVDGAYEALRVKVTEEIVMNMKLNPESQTEVMTAVNNFLANVDLDDIKIGTTLDQTGFEEGLQALLDSGAVTVEQMNSILEGIGYEPNIEYEKIEVASTAQSSQTGYVQTTDVNGTVRDVPIDAVMVVDGKQYVEVPKIGSSKFKGGGRGVANAKKGSGGGGGSKPKKTSESRKKKSDVVDRYKEVNDKLEETNRLLEKNNVEADSLWGPKRIAALKNGLKILEQENKLLKEKYELSKSYLKEDTTALHQAAANAGISFTIDNLTGNITNYTNAMTQLFNERERLLDSFGSTISESEEAKLAAFDDKIEKVKEAYEQYEKTLDEKQDLEQEQIEKTVEIQQQYYDILSEELEIKITINDNDLKLLEYHLGRIEDDFYNMAEAAAIMVDSSNSLGISQMDIYSNNLANYSDHLKQLEDDYAAGKISQADYIQGLQDTQDGIISNLKSLDDLDDAMIEYYGNTLDMAIEEIAKYTDQMDHLVGVLDHYQSLMEIMGKENNYAAMGVVLEGRAKLLEDQVAVSKSTMEMLKNEADNRYQDYQNALESGDDAAAEVYLKQYEDALAAANEAEDKFLSQAEEWAESLKAVLENKLKGLNKTLEEALTGGTSFDSLNTAMERAKSLQEEYLTTTNKIYETNKLMRKAQQEIDKTTNSVAKKRLQEFITETDQLQDKAKLSKFELDIQQAKYDLLLAEIALQEAQNAKSTVRLQKDSEGNFGYVYTADENLVAEAEQTLLDKQNELYNLSLDGANEYKEKYLQTLNEMYDTLADLQQQKMDGMFASEEEYQQAVAEATQFYYEQLEQYADLHGIAIATDGRVINEAWSADFADMVQNTAVWKIAVDEYLIGAEEAFNQWAEDISKVAETVGIPLDQIGNGVENITEGFSKLKDEVSNVTDESTQLKDALIGKGGMIDTVQSEITAVKSVTEKYANLREELGRVKKSYEDLMATINATIKAQANLSSSSNAGNTSQTGSTSSSGSKSNTGSKGDTGSKGGTGSKDGTKPTTPPLTYKTVTVWKNSQGDESEKISISSGGVRIVSVTDPRHPHPRKIYDVNTKKSGWVTAEKALEYDQFDTGGYTGQWGPSGKWAMLHEKELVLNKKDTENFLASMDILDKIISVIDLHSANAQLGGLLSTPQYSGFKDNQVLEQNVRIEASFPNATNHSEIEEAFNNLINTASQYANRK